MIDAMARPKKRLFLALILISLIIAIISTYGIWKVSLPGLANISQFLPLILGSLLMVLVVVIMSGVIGIILAIIGCPTPKFMQGVAWWAINMLFPLAILVGKVLLDIDKEKIERSFIEVSNHLIKNKHIKVQADKLLILTPHCIQQEACPHKITRDASNCRRCGNCQVGELVTLAEKYGAHLAIVTGGTLARKVVKTVKPRAILAIACERDLTSGIQDVFPLPVIGILNERPYGPCCNTRVNMEKVEETVKNFVLPRRR